LREDTLALPAACAACGCADRYDASMDWNGVHHGLVSGELADRAERAWILINAAFRT
jgi:hypothetical protein